MLGQERVRAGLDPAPRAPRLVAEALELLEHPDIRPEARVGDLGVGAQQLVEVARALVSQRPGHRLRRADQLALRARRRAAVRDHRAAARRAGWRSSTSAISSRKCAGSPRRYTVLRDGRAVAAGPAGRDRPAGRSSRHMVGRDLDELFPHVPHTPGEPILELDRTSRAEARPGRRAWRCGAARSWASPGLVGAGRTTLVRAIFGLEPVVSGRIRVQHVAGGYAPPRPRIAQGLGFLSEDRKGEGLALGRSIEDNMTYSALRRHARRGWLRLKRAARRGRPLDRAAADRARPARPRPSAASPAATSRRWRWRGCSTSRPTSCCSTSRRAASTSAPRPRSIA